MIMKKNFLILCSLVNMSNMYRRISEKLIDEFFNNDKGEIEMKNSSDLKRELYRIDGKGYKSYKGFRGTI